MNSVILIGRLTKNPELRYTTGGDPMAVCRISIAVDRPGKGDKKAADFPNIVVFGRQAENLEKYTAKGDRIAVQGRIQTGKYEKNGQTVYTTDVIADRIEFLGNKTEKQSQSDNIQYDVPEGFAAIRDDDIPF